MADWGAVHLTIDDGRAIKNLEISIQTFGMQLTTLAPAFEKIGEDLLDDNAQNFGTEGAMYQELAWAPLAPSTIRDRLRQGYGEGPIMQRTGFLYDSLTQRGAPMNIFEVTDTSVRVGTRVPYAGYQHFGTEKMPARFLVGVRPFTRIGGIKARITDYVNTLIASTFRRS